MALHLSLLKGPVMRPQLNEFGQEVPDNEPVVIHIKGRIYSQFDQVRDFIRRELVQHRSGEVETFEEANDFDVHDDLFPVSPSEYTEDTEAADREVLERARARSPQDNKGKPEGSAPSGSPAPGPATPPLEAPPAS